MGERRRVRLCVRNARRKAAVCIALVSAWALTGCCALRGYSTPKGVECWQDTSPPKLSLAEKAQGYQTRLEELHQREDGVIRYRFDTPRAPYGNLPDGSFFLGIYLSSQALRFAATGDESARQQILLSLRAMKLYAEVSGKPGLLARYLAPVKPDDDDRWLQSKIHPEYFWRSDVSKDQYAGCVHGLGVTYAVVADPEVRAAIAPIATAIADHLVEHDLRIVDWDGEPTTFSSLRGRAWGYPLGVNALIALAAAKVAAVASDDPKYAKFYDSLVNDGYPELSSSAHISFFGAAYRVNDNMAYLAWYPLLLLERNGSIRRKLQAGARKTWSAVSEDQNAFFSFVHAATVGTELDELGDGEKPEDEGRQLGKKSLAKFPDRKVAWPVDLTRERFDFPRAFLKGKSCLPRSTRPIPLYLRYRGSSMWVSDPYALVGRLTRKGDREYAGIDYLVAYWIGRFHGFVSADE